MTDTDTPRPPLTKDERDELRKETEDCLADFAARGVTCISDETVLRLLDQVEALEETYYGAAHPGVAEPRPSVSETLCVSCDNPCVEFHVPNDVWNAVVRKGGPEHDKEFLCVWCYHKAVEEYVRKMMPITNKKPPV
jgi:hypothetical protein